jgi:hypothetical protein
VAGGWPEEVLRDHSVQENDLPLVSAHHTKTGEDGMVLIGCVDTVDIALVSPESCCIHKVS